MADQGSQVGVASRVRNGPVQEGTSPRSDTNKTATDLHCVWSLQLILTCQQ